MNLTRTGLWLATLLVAAAMPAIATAAEPPVLWYAQPADTWVEAAPLGNGRLGAMVFGSAPIERLQLNEESLWAGELTDTYPEGFYENLKKMQRLVLAGRISEARALGLEKMTLSPTSFRSYEPLCDLWIEMDHGRTFTDYRRQLDMESGMARVQYTVDGVQYQREVFISAPADAIIVRLSASKPGSIRAKVRLTRKKDMKITAAGNDRLRMDGQIIDDDSPGARDPNPGGSGPGGAHMKFAGRLLAKTTGGSVRTEGDALHIDGADVALLLFSAATDYNVRIMNFDRSIDPGKLADDLLDRAARKDWKALLQAHTAEHRALFHRVSLDLGGEDRRQMPTDQRLEAVKKGRTDPQLEAQYFQYGRYLLMSSSRRPGRLPANLQGLWNEHMWAPWEADYHLNINLQMNYWPADLCNLPGTMEPLLDWFIPQTEKGRASAKKLYHANGWVSFTASNVFGRSTPSGSTRGSQFTNGVLDPLPGAWMAMTLWRHYQFTQDETYLRNRAYPVLKGAAEFLLDYLVEDQNGHLVVVPSTSPENAYIHPETGKAVRITRGSTYHTTLTRVVFEAVAEAADTLDTDQAFREKLQAALRKLPPLKIGADGTLQEWIEDYKEREPHHRHVSHLLGLHPFSLITVDDPALFTAARKALDRRGAGGDVGWSNAWKINFFARLRDAEQAHAYLQRLIGRNTFANFMDACFPGRLFQIDGNFGGTAGIAEMLLQSHARNADGDYIIDLLPALPKAWPNGQVTGLRARGGFVVNIQWKKGKLSEVTIESERGGTAPIRYRDLSVVLDTRAGQTCRLAANLEPGSTP